MTREEAIAILSDEEISYLIRKFHGGKVALNLALSALRPVSREQVEKVWRGEWELIGADKRVRGGIFRCTRCRGSYPVKNDFCPHCGAPMTDEAVEMVMERMEALKDGDLE